VIRPPLAICSLLGVALLAGCGASSGPRSVLSQATTHIGDVRAGTLSLRFTLTPDRQSQASGVGIALAGPFALDPRHRLPILHVTYTRLAGTQTTSATIDSDGQTASILSAGRRLTLNAQQQQQLSATLQGPHGLGQLPLHVDRWVDHPRQTRGATFNGHPSDQVTGSVDLPNALADLNQLTGGQVQRATGSDSSRALEKTLRSSSFRAVVGRQDHLLRQLELRVDLAPSLAAVRGGLPNQGLSIAFDVQLSPRPLA
jgi:hypothetical protein